MESVFTLGYLRIPHEHAHELLDLWNDFHRFLLATEGPSRATVWQQVGMPESILTAIHWEENDNPERIEQAFAESDAYCKLTRRVDGPIHTVRIVERTTLRSQPLDNGIGGYLSVSQRVADIGYEADLHEELERIFEELTVIDGFLGAMIAQRDILPQEFFGLVAWSTQEAFVRSLPRTMPYEVRFYQRLC